MAKADTSKELYLVNPTPGVFYSDDIYANPYPETLRGYDADSQFDITQSIGQGIKETNAPFMMGTWNSRNKDLDKHDTIWHMYSGARDSYDLNNPNKKWDNWYGWGNLFSATSHSRYRGGSDNIANHTNLELYTNHQMTEECGLLIGSKSIGEAYECTARWMSPVGIQFKWHNLFTKGNATSMKMWNLHLMYTDMWAPSKLLYAPIVSQGQNTNGRSYSRGIDILTSDDKITGGDAGGHACGEYVGFVDPNSMDLIKDKYSVSACIGLWVEMHINKYDGASYDKVFDFWDFKPLFDVDENQSMIVYPQPHNLRERMEQSKVKLL